MPAPQIFGIQVWAAGDGLVDDTAAIQRTIDQAIAAGGGIVDFGIGTYRLTAPLIVKAPPDVSLRLCGATTIGAILRQDGGATQDIFQIGATDADLAERFHLSDLSLLDGRYALNLNNALGMLCERIRINGAQIGLYLQGTNEHHTFRQMQIEGCALHAIYGGATNGGSAEAVLNLPEVQKCRFEQIRVSSTLGGSAIVLTAGNLGSQQQSGHNLLTQILCESNHQGSIELHWAFNTWIDGLSTEEQLDADDTYAAVVVDHQSTVNATHLSLIAGITHPKYQVDVRSGHCSIGQSLIVGGTTADIHVTGNLTLMDSYVTNLDQVQFDNQAARNYSSLRDVRDGGGNLVTWTP